MTSCLMTHRAVQGLGRLFCRFRYPVSLPEDVAVALGVDLPNHLSFDELMAELVSPALSPTKLHRFMLREVAERAFSSAVRKETFGAHSIFSFYFREGWMEFVLHFDEHARLRRVYLQHKKIHSPRGKEMDLRCDEVFRSSLAPMAC